MTLRIPGKAQGHFPDNWKRCVGSGHMALALQRDYQDALRLVQDAIGFDYIRGHGLLTDDMGVYRTHMRRPMDRVDGVLRDPYNFLHVDRVFDAYLEIGIRPFVELGFMPTDLASGTQTQFYWKGNVTPPKDYAEWRKLITKLVKHMVKRYGIEEVRHWPFEVWNEPDIPGFWKDGDQNEYFRLYRETAYAVKEADASLQVGGPATCPGAIKWIEPFLAMCEKGSVPVDFVTTHAYYGAAYSACAEFGYQDVHEEEHALRLLRQARDLIDASAYPDLPLHITEFNSSWSPICPVHDTAFNAAFLGRMLSEAGDLADSFSYWTFSDVFEELDLPRSQFHGGFGLVALNNIVKPTFHLFEFFGHLGSDLLCRTGDLIATRRADGCIAIVAWNPVKDPEADGGKTLTIEIETDAADNWVERRRVHEGAGNAWNVWRAMGRPRTPSFSQLDTLQHASVPALETARIGAEDGVLKLELQLQRNEVTLIEIRPREDETATYTDLDESRIPGYGK